VVVRTQGGRIAPAHKGGHRVKRTASDIVVEQKVRHFQGKKRVGGNIEQQKGHGVGGFFRKPRLKSPQRKGGGSKKVRGKVHNLRAKRGGQLEKIGKCSGGELKGAPILTSHTKADPLRQEKKRGTGG